VCTQSVIRGGWPQWLDVPWQCWVLCVYVERYTRWVAAMTRRTLTVLSVVCVRRALYAVGGRNDTMYLDSVECCVCTQSIIRGGWPQWHDVPWQCGEVWPRAVYVVQRRAAAEAATLYDGCELPRQTVRVWRRVDDGDCQHGLQVSSRVHYWPMSVSYPPPHGTVMCSCAVKKLLTHSLTH